MVFTVLNSMVDLSMAMLNNQMVYTYITVVLQYIVIYIIQLFVHQIIIRITKWRFEWDIPPTVQQICFGSV